jgi:hypothetical protein
MGTDFFQTRGLKPQPERLGGWLRRLPRERGDCRSGPPGLVQPDGRGAFEGLDTLHRRATGVSRVGEPVHTDMPSVEDSTTRPSVVGLAPRWTRSPRRISVSPDPRPPPRPARRPTTAGSVSRIERRTLWREEGSHSERIGAGRGERPSYALTSPAQRGPAGLQGGGLGACGVRASHGQPGAD